MSSHGRLLLSTWKESNVQTSATGVAADRPPEAPILATIFNRRGRRRVFLDGLSAREPVIRRVVLCAVLYSLPVIALSQPVLDPDIWWHVRTGQWLVEHGRVPATDPFSTFGHGRPWVAYSWLFEIIVFGVFRTFGLLGIWIYRAIMTFIVAVALHRLLISREPRYARIVGLLAAAFLALLAIDSERPWQFSILFGILTLAVIEAVRAGRRSWWLLLLPPAFSLWANIHIQFVYGLGLLGLAIICGLIDDRVRKTRSLPRQHHAALVLLALLIACVLATGINPYGFGVYRPVFEYSGHSYVYNYIQEHRAPEFRSLGNWCLVGLAGMAAFALGRRPFRETYLVALLVAGIYLGFHSGRDCWVLVLAALVILTSDAPRSCPISECFAYTRRRVLATGSLVALLLGITAWWNDISPSLLQRAVAHVYPEEAAAYIERSVPRGPIYNHLNWGGYLIWRLPDYAVTIDGRTNLHGDDRIERSERTWSGRSHRWADPEFQAARIVVADRKSALAEILRLDPQFERIYDDSVAVVFRSRAGAESPRKGTGDAGSITANRSLEIAPSSLAGVFGRDSRAVISPAGIGRWNKKP